MSVIVLGLGNRLLGDDGVGLHAAELLRAPLAGVPDVQVGEDPGGGLALMERLAGHDAAVLVDAVCTGTHVPGTVLRFDVHELPACHTVSPHDVNLPEALRLADALGFRPPRTVRVVGVEAADVAEFREGCTAQVEAALPRVVAAVLEEVEELSRRTR